MQKSAIEWTDNTWNPWYGCLKISPGCKNCYMYRDMGRTTLDPKVVTKSKTMFTAPLKWKEPALVFTCSWSDWFIEEADPWREAAWDIIRQTPHLTYQILTKRTENIVQRLPADWGAGWDNVWLGTSIENDDYIYRGWQLADIPAQTRFISYEPALGALDPARISPLLETGKIHWLISGGESGPKARTARLDWFTSIRDICKANNVAYFHKQHGGQKKLNGAWGGRELEGRLWDEYPERVMT